ncbi:MAG TPA: ACP S-malonyltransferase [Lacipirellulaceae bacterium]|jgi:[acyl-carrier-protein] S-malonyltransferase|nr:ACP S-malonyltransferase [Lacipirellulaceae bacterium]
MSDSTKIAFLFPGQGAQDVGMGAAACAKSPAAKALFERAAGILGYDLYKLCTEGPKSELDSTVNSQPALFVSSLAALEVLKQEQPAIVDQCAATAGLSLGEYTALVFAGVMDFEAGLRVVQERGRAMQAAADATSSGMVSVLGMEREQVEQLVDEARSDQVLEVANLLCPGNIVCSGETAACERLLTLATDAGAMKVIPLSVAGAFHTSLMQPAVERLRKALADVPLKKPRIPVVSNVDARPHEDPNEIRELLIKQVCSQVRWENSMRYLLEDVQITQFYEIGAGRVLAGLLKRIARKTPVENIAA